MKLSKIYKCFDKERAKTLLKQSMRKKKTEKTWASFYNKLFYKVL